MKLADNVALVTGAGRGIGRRLATSLAQEGARVVINYPIDEEEANGVVSEIEASGGAAIAIRADISDTRERGTMFERVEREFGRLDILINNAAVDPGQIDFLEVDEEFYDNMMGVNLKGAFFCCQAAARLMIRRSVGRIINISSVQGQQHIVRYGPYSVTKGGLNALTRQLALDLAPHGITVNAIAPGFIEVERNIRIIGDYSREKIARQIPAGRVGFPADIAALACFLASPEAGFITGQVIVSDGGVTARIGS